MKRHPVSPVGNDFVTRRQLEHLITLTENKWFTVQLLPYAARCTAVLVGSALLAQENGVPIAAYVESAVHGRVALRHRATGHRPVGSPPRRPGQVRRRRENRHRSTSSVSDHAALGDPPGAAPMAKQL
ncbi:Scr1 family TA system antitoxin-like transcriptional regulator [Nonomuraea sp. ZG12]|uniref:Scr1 family TA system antitoxin-like transcriptional regulator n=1 Tax=Nonomuraea sp. ZG12 TaxID=3452207 RepID=UPI003F895F9D